MLKPTPDLVTLETLFRALGDRTRLRILNLLRGGEVCVCHIHEALRIPQPTASRHLAYLRRAGLVQRRKEGLWAHYSLSRPTGRVLGSLLDAAVHGLAHLEATTRDAKRLERATGVRMPGLQPASGCCAAATGTGDSTGRTPSTRQSDRDNARSIGG